MITQVIDLLQSTDFVNSKLDNIIFAKGGYRYPRTFKETFKIFKLWR